MRNFDKFIWGRDPLPTQLEDADLDPFEALEIARSLGFADDVYETSRLSRSWKHYPAGTLVVHGLAMRGSPFYLEVAGGKTVVPT